MTVIERPRLLHYSPLDTNSNGIRLLTLLPSTDPVSIPECEIFHISLDNNTRYNALSYTWDNLQVREMITIDGQKISVGRNLAYALSDIRDKTDRLVIGVDAVCIDQQNVSGKNHQVMQMGKIYKRADCVIAWLGRNHHIDDALSTVKTFDDSETFEKDDVDREIWPKMEPLCNLSYWTRLWIVQEIGLAAKVEVYNARSHVSLLGKETPDILTRESASQDQQSKAELSDLTQSLRKWGTDLVDFFQRIPQDILENMEKLPSYPPELEKQLFELQSLIYTPRIGLGIREVEMLGKSLSELFAAEGALLFKLEQVFEKLTERREKFLPSSRLRTLLENCERLVCQDPKDKVYGLLGLASNLEEEIMNIDYSKSLFEIFDDVLNVTYWANDVDEESAGERLGRCSQLMQRSLGGPLDVPRLGLGDSTGATFTANVFKLVGYATDSILPIEEDGASAASRIDTGHTTIHSERQLMLDGFLVSTYTDAKVRRKTITTILKQLEAVKKEILYPSAAPIKCYATQTPNLPFDESLAGNHISGKQKQQSVSHPGLFITKSGHIGISTPLIREDDMLVRFSNCDVAAIMRPSSSEGYLTYVARAFLARGAHEREKRVTEISPEISKYSVPDEESLKKKDQVYLWMDTVTLQALTCPATGEKKEFKFAAFA